LKATWRASVFVASWMPIVALSSGSPIERYWNVMAPLASRIAWKV
jgi:hypothetical protein